MSSLKIWCTSEETSTRYFLSRILWRLVYILKKMEIQTSLIYRNHKLSKAFSKFDRRHFDLINNIMSVWRNLYKVFLIQNPMEIWYINLRNLKTKLLWSFQTHVYSFKREGYTLNILRQTACPVFNQVVV